LLSINKIEINILNCSKKWQEINVKLKMNKKDDPLLKDENLEISEDLQESKDLSKEAEGKPVFRKYRTKHMKLFPELYRSDVSIHPSYTGLKILP